MINQRGGIISKLFIIPMGVALMVGFFFLGYYVGKYQSKTAASGEIAPPLPAIASNNGQKLEEFTFYKTLADKNDKTVSIDLKTKPVKEATKPMPISEAPKEKRLEVNLGKESSSTARPKQLASKHAAASEERACRGILEHKNPLYRSDGIIPGTGNGRG